MANEIPMTIDSDEARVFEARHCPGLPTECVDYGVISHVTGKEVCRVWERDDAELIADLLNGCVDHAFATPEPACGEVRGLVERLRENADPRCNQHIRSLSLEAADLLSRLTATDAVGGEAELGEDAFGNTGERDECPSCAGTGLDYGGTCLGCGGFGWVSAPANLLPTPPKTTEASK